MTETDDATTTVPTADQAPLEWRTFAPILAVQFIGTLGYSIAIPFLVFLITDLGGAAWTYGVVGAMYSACQLVGAPILGRWSDRVGRRPVLVVSQAGTMFAWLLFLLALQLPMTTLGSFAGATLTLPLVVVTLARACDGLTGGNVSVANAYVADLTRDKPKARQVSFGRMGMAASLGFMLGPAIAGLLGAMDWGYVAPVLAAAGVSGVATVLCLLLPDPGGECDGEKPKQPTVTKIMGQQHKPCHTEPTPTGSAFRDPLVVALLTATFVLFLGFNLFFAGFPVHANEALGWDAGQMGAFFTVMAGVMIVAQGPGLRIATAYLPRRAVFGLGMVSLITAFVLYTLNVEWLLYGGAAFYAIGNGIAWPTFQARVAEAAPPEDMGAVQGAATSAGSLASILGLLVGGILYPYFGANLFLGAAGLFTIVLFGTPIWFRAAPTRPAPEADADPNNS